MLKRPLLIIALLTLTSAPDLHAQAKGPCANPSTKLICLVPQLYSETGVPGVDLPNAAHQAHFDADFIQDASALNAAIGSELAARRLASPSSGLIFVFDKSAGVVIPSRGSLGPILGERAETLGRRRLFVAATYQYFPFSSLDGIDLKHLPAVYRHKDGLNPDGTERTKTDPVSPGDPVVEQEYITTDNRIDLKVHQVTLYATFGLTNRVDVSVAVPFLNVRMGVNSSATIVRTADSLAIQPIPESAYLNDPTSLMGRLYATTGPDQNCAKTLSPPCSGYFHYFDPAHPATSLQNTFTRFRTATGLGDMTFRLKGTVIKRERAAAAIGADVRVPTGDENDFLGSGAAGFKPFIAASYRARITPHINLGYEFNGSSILAGDPTTGQKPRLPDQLLYSIGADVGITNKLTVAADLLGAHLYGAPRFVEGPFVDVNKGVHADIKQTQGTRGSLNINDLMVGGKYDLYGKLLLTANLQIKLDDGGLRAKVVPLIGLSYTF